jgi:hypothetical protein
MDWSTRMNGKVWALAAAGLSVATISGCVSYASYPPAPKNTAINDPNTPAMEELMEAGLKWVVNRYPPGAEGTAFAVNIPKGVKPVVYRHVAAAAGGQPLTAENSAGPVYHVTSIRVRGDQGNVWIARPVVSLGSTPQGKPVYQEVKLWFQGGLSPWHVVNALDGTPGGIEAPELNFYEPESAPMAMPSKVDDPVYKPAPKPVEEEALKADTASAETPKPAPAKAPSKSKTAPKSAPAKTPPAKSDTPAGG